MFLRPYSGHGTVIEIDVTPTIWKMRLSITGLQKDLSRIWPNSSYEKFKYHFKSTIEKISFLTKFTRNRNLNLTINNGFFLFFGILQISYFECRVLVFCPETSRQLFL